jgi:hypothetical protein
MDDSDARVHIYANRAQFRSVWRKLRGGSSPLIRITNGLEMHCEPRIPAADYLIVAAAPAARRLPFQAPIVTPVLPQGFCLFEEPP